MSERPENFVAELTQAVQEWANHHPWPNKALFWDAKRHKNYSARFLANEVSSNTPFGQEWIQQMENLAATKYGDGVGYVELIESINEITNTFFKIPIDGRTRTKQ